MRDDFNSLSLFDLTRLAGRRLPVPLSLCLIDYSVAHET